MQQSSKPNAGSNIPVVCKPIVGERKMPAMGMNTPSKGNNIALGRNDMDKDGDKMKMKGPNKPRNEY